MTRHHTASKTNTVQPKASAAKAPMLWDRSRTHRDRLGRRIAQLRRTGHA